VALSCFIRSTLRGMLAGEEFACLPHSVLVENLGNVMRDGLRAMVRHPESKIARQVCRLMFEIASEYATSEERRYLCIVLERIENGNLSNLILRDVAKKAQKTELKEAIFHVYSSLADCLEKNRIYV